MALDIALTGAREAGAKTRLLDLSTYALGFCTGKDSESQYSEDVFRLRREVQDAQGILLGSPEYHGSFSGVLKNALDLMGFAEFEGKMVGLVGVSGGRMGGLNAVGGLRTIGRSLHAWVTPDEATIPNVWQVFAKDGTCKDAGIEKRLKEVGQSVTRFAYLHTSSRTREFLAAWEQAQANPGGTHDE